MGVYLKRHGETPRNAARVPQYPDTPLSERSTAQSEGVGQRLAAARDHNSGVPRGPN